MRPTMLKRTCLPLTVFTAALASPISAQGPAELEGFLDRAFDELGLVPGMAVAVVRDSSIVVLRGFGVSDISSGSPVTPGTPFYIASSTKSFMGTASAALDLRGDWSLDDPLARWLPRVALPDPLSTRVITIRDLLTHTSRIENDAITYRTAYSGEHDRATLLSMLTRSEVLEPGFDYGNIGYVIASLAMDSAARMSWKDVLDRELFQPIGMTATSAYRSAFDGQLLALPHGVALGAHPFEVRRYVKVDANMHAAGGIITNAADLARWLQANLNEGRVDGRQAVSAAAIRAAHEILVPTDAKFHDFGRTGYGLGWYHGEYDGDRTLHHFGNYPGFRAHVSFMPEHGIGVAVLTNESSQGYFVPEAVATAIYDRLLGKPDVESRWAASREFLFNDALRVRSSVRKDAAERALRPDTLALPATAYTGSYYSPLGGTLTIEERGFGRLGASIGVLSSLLEPAGPDRPELLRAELIPGNGEWIEFFHRENHADSVAYKGVTFRRR